MRETRKNKIKCAARDIDDEIRHALESLKYHEK